MSARESLQSEITMLLFLFEMTTDRKELLYLMSIMFLTEQPI